MARQRNALTGHAWLRWAYLAPALAFTAVFFIVPLVFIAVVSPMRWDGIGPMTFTGARNFSRLARDPVFVISVANTLIWIVVGLFAHLPLALLAALALCKRPPLWRLFRTAFFIPSIISTTALALLWTFIFHPEFGLAGAVMRLAGWRELGAIAWLANVSTALWASQLPYVIYIGFPMMVFLTQIAAIPEEYFEAARIDGATVWQIDRYVTIPLIKPALLINALFVTTYCLRLFEYPFIMTDGGPANATSNLSLFIYKSMVQSYDYGGAMAASAVTVIIGVAVMALLLRLGRTHRGAA